MREGGAVELGGGAGITTARERDGPWQVHGYMSILGTIKSEKRRRREERSDECSCFESDEGGPSAVGVNDRPGLLSVEVSAYHRTNVPIAGAVA